MRQTFKSINKAPAIVRDYVSRCILNAVSFPYLIPYHFSYFREPYHSHDKLDMLKRTRS